MCVRITIIMKYVLVRWTGVQLNCIRYAKSYQVHEKKVSNLQHNKLKRSTDNTAVTRMQCAVLVRKRVLAPYT